MERKDKILIIEGRYNDQQRLINWASKELKLEPVVFSEPEPGIYQPAKDSRFVAAVIAEQHNEFDWKTKEEKFYWDIPTVPIELLVWACPNMPVFLTSRFPVPRAESQYLVGYSDVVRSLTIPISKPLNARKLREMKSIIERRKNASLRQHLLPEDFRQWFEQQYDSIHIDPLLLTDPVVLELAENSAVKLFAGGRATGKTTAALTVGQWLKEFTQEASDKSLDQIHHKLREIVRAAINPDYFTLWDKWGKRDTICLTIADRERKEETQGKEHWLMSKEAIWKLRDNGRLLLYAEILDPETGKTKYYGIDIDEVKCRKVIWEFLTDLLYDYLYEKFGQKINIPIVWHGKTVAMMVLMERVFRKAEMFIMQPEAETVDEKHAAIIGRLARSRGIEADLPSIQQKMDYIDLLLGIYMLVGHLPRRAKAIIDKIEKWHIFPEIEPPDP